MRAKSLGYTIIHLLALFAEFFASRRGTLALDAAQRAKASVFVLFFLPVKQVNWSFSLPEEARLRLTLGRGERSIRICTFVPGKQVN
jgi:hypothetical protein